MAEIPGLPSKSAVDSAVLAVHQNSLAGLRSVVLWNVDHRHNTQEVGLDVLRDRDGSGEPRLVLEIDAAVKDPTEIRQLLLDKLRDKYPQKGLDVFL